MMTMLHIPKIFLLYLTAYAPLAAAQYKYTNYKLFPNVTYPGAESQNPITIAGSESFQSSPPDYPSPWGEGLEEWANAYEKSRSFVSQLTLEEKVNLTTGTGWRMDRCTGQTGSIPRLGFNALCLQDSPTGVRSTDFISVFPAGINIAATWSRDLAQRRGRAMGKEHRRKGVVMQLGPVAGPLMRTPEGGRNWEGFSPDPYLTGIMFAETIRGTQSANVMASAKHLVGYEQEHMRLVDEAHSHGWNVSESYSSNLDDVTMHELYLWPFADGVRAGAASVMCSYSQVNNSQSCQNSYLLNHLLKKELGFQGFVLSDWFATHSGASSIMAGLDMTMPGGTEMQNTLNGRSYFGANLTIAALNGTVPQWRIDDAATRIVAAWYFVGRDKVNETINFSSSTKETYGFEHSAVGQGYGIVNEHRDVRGNHSALIRKLGADSTVLLKNTNSALPLTGLEKLTAVFGEDAGPNPQGPNSCKQHGCVKGTVALGWGSGHPDFSSLVTPAEAIHDVVKRSGGAYQPILDNYAVPQIKDIAPRASVSIVFVNADSGNGGIVVDDNYGDRNNVTLWGGGPELVRNVSSLCNNTIVVVHAPGAVLLDEIKENPNVTALLWAGFPGEQTGNSIADVLYGRVNPGAKLPFTIGARREDWGTDVLYMPNEGTGVSQLNYKEGIFIDYRGFDKRNITPTYEFGYGLSYTTFHYSDIRVIKHKARDYAPAEGHTSSAPTSGTVSPDLEEHMFPANFSRVPLYLYPWPNSTNLSASSADAHYGSSSFLPSGARDTSPQTIVPAGGAPGGNPALWDVVYTVEATISNTGAVAGEEVCQLYISLGGPYDAPLVLRGFDRLAVEPGQSVTFQADVRRRDIMNWDVVAQNWYVSRYPKKVFVGSSSRSLHLSAVLSDD